MNDFVLTYPPVYHSTPVLRAKHMELEPYHFFEMETVRCFLTNLCTMSSANI